MNSSRRNALRKIIDAINGIISDLLSLVQDEDDARFNMPESLANSEAFDRSEECSDAMRDATESLQDAVNYIEEVI